MQIKPIKTVEDNKAALKYIIHFITVNIIASFLSGCAITYKFKNDIFPATNNYAVATRWPIAVGVYASSSVKSKIIKYEAWKMPAGDPAFDRFSWAISQMFSDTVELNSSPLNNTLPKGLSGAIELTNISYHHEEPSSLTYDVSLYSRTGVVINTWSISVTGDPVDLEESSTSMILYNIGTKLSYNIRDVTAKFMVTFMQSDEVHKWLDSEGVDQTVSSPVYNDIKNKNLFNDYKIKILFISNIKTWYHTDDYRGMNCVGKNLKKFSQSIEVIPIEDVKLLFYPWMEPSTGPKSLEAIIKLFSDPAINKKVNIYGFNYILLFSGETITDWDGGILCTGGFGAAGCLGFQWGDRKSSFSAVLLDINTGKILLDQSATRTGKSYIPAIILPIPIIAATESTACEELSKKLYKILTSEF